jgi:plastocyanin domain-containing protein
VKNLIIAITAVAALVGCKQHEAAAPAEQPQAQQQQPAPTATQPAPEGVQTVDIKVSGGEYSPASFTVQKGKPVRLNFTRDEKPTCGDTLVIPAFNIKKDIPLNQVVSVDITPQQAGELKFTCGMDMLRGTIVVQ